MNKGSSFLKFILKSVAILLVTLNGAISLSHTFFIHKHTLEDGKVVFHSHPHKKSDNESEKHNHNDFTYHISSASDVTLSEYITYLFSEQYIYIDSQLFTVFTEKSCFHLKFLRAPPHIIS